MFWQFTWRLWAICWQVIIMDCCIIAGCLCSCSCRQRFSICLAVWDWFVWLEITRWMYCSSAVPIPTFVEDMSISDMLDVDVPPEVVSPSITIESARSHNGIVSALFFYFFHLVSPNHHEWHEMWQSKFFRAFCAWSVWDPTALATVIMGVNKW